jgi:hypothetical protein|tara:strand:+ start:2499 stop:2603 length:105 start_codon:yes stop_codon:yes gene_type:complete
MEKTGFNVKENGNVRMQKGEFSRFNGRKIGIFEV